MKTKKITVNRDEYNGFFRNALAIKGSVTPKVFKNVMFVVVYSCLISYLHHLIPSIALPIGPFEYAGLIMGLILAFRTNAGYDRWWEARKLWGNVVNHSRNLAIIVANYPNTINQDLKIRLINYIAAWPYLMKNHLQGNVLIDEVARWFGDDLIAILSQSDHKPNVLSSIIAQELHALHVNHELDSFAFMQAEEKRALILDCQGGCERILKTPIPFVMAVKSRRFILLFLLALPFAMVNVSILISPIVTGLVSYALFSLDQIGVELQNPFSENRLSHLPLNDICRTIEKNVIEIQEMVGVIERCPTRRQRSVTDNMSV